MSLLDQAEHGYSKCGRKCDSCDKFVLEKTFQNSKFAETSKMLYI